MRGMVTRPSCNEVANYRAAVDEAMAALLRDPPPEVPALLELGLQHEEQHQELLLTDILHLLSANPLRPAYDAGWQPPLVTAGLSRMLDGPQGVVEFRTGPGSAARLSDVADLSIEPAGESEDGYALYRLTL